MTKYVYIDSNIFIQDNFSMGGEQLEEELTICKYLGYELLCTDITQDEVTKVLTGKAAELKKLSNNLQKFNDWLNPDSEFSNFSSQCNDFSNSIIGDCSNDIELFFKNKGFITLKILELIEANDIRAIMDDYFGQTGQFSNRSKPVEFNDALQLKMIQGKVKVSDELIFVSGDQDFRKAINAASLKVTALKSIKSFSESVSDLLQNTTPRHAESSVLEAIEEFNSDNEVYPTPGEIRLKLESMTPEAPDNTKIDFLLSILKRRELINIDEKNGRISIRCKNG
ncbi:PIN domain-containing protein [Marinagarivorans algicola]|uniref:PIN domain-containing protein n=1 Tax=Marinagarivorans algicola TaxID=1513270 RepID=UPI0006B98644|nr:PIN domain-containing protein [Marinagarivorans algicola]